MTFQHFRAHRTAHLSVGLALSATGLLLGPLIMDPSYRLMRPAFQGTTVLWVELLFAFLIDFPLTMVATAVICALTRCRNPGDAITAGLVFLGIFFSSIVLCIAIGDRVPGIGTLALTGVFPPALSSAREAFGGGALAAMLALYLVFDVTLCALGALAGHWFARIATRRVSASAGGATTSPICRCPRCGGGPSAGHRPEDQDQGAHPHAEQADLRLADWTTR